jgi:hypothetical protein
MRWLLPVLSDQPVDFVGLVAVNVEEVVRAPQYQK